MLSGLKRYAAGAVGRAAYVRALSIAERGGVSEAERRGSVVIAPTPAGSVGDEAMITAVSDALESAGAGPVDLLAPGAIDGWPEMASIRSIIPFGKRDSGSYARVARLVSGYERSYLIGADVIDGGYSAEIACCLIRLAGIAHAAGCRSTIVGSSFREKTAAGVVRAIEGLDGGVRVCVRDAVSRGRLSSWTKRPTVLTADSAFMLRPLSSSERIGGELEWIDRRRSEGRAVLAVNFNHHVIGASEPERESKIEGLLGGYVGAVDRLLEGRDDVAVLFVPHDYRGPKGDHAMGARLAGAVSPRHAGRVRAVTERLLPGEIKAIAGAVDASLAARMHFAIATLGSGRPAACITYAGKFAGLFGHFGIEPLTISPDEAADAGRLWALMTELIERRDELAGVVAERLPGVLALSRLNLGLGGDGEVAGATGIGAARGGAGA